MSCNFQDFLRDLRGPAELPDLAQAVELAEDPRVALQRAAVELRASAKATYTRRNRMAGRRFLERCCLGALAAERDRLAAEAERLVKTFKACRQCGELTFERDGFCSDLCQGQYDFELAGEAE